MHFSIKYEGNGVVRVTKLQASGDPTKLSEPMFESPRLVDGLFSQGYCTDWVPGWGCISFDKDVWDSFIINYYPESIKISHDAWDCDAYHNFLRNNPQR